MKVLMATNTYLPHVGGVARSVSAFTRELRRRGHEVRVLAPAFDGRLVDEVEERGILRVPAWKHFHGSEFSVPIPLPGYLELALDLDPEVVHAHHPFLLGESALRLARERDLPLVFTHHTMFEHYTHYLPGDGPGWKTFIKDLTVGYANLADAVIAPSESIARQLVRRGITAEVVVIPTGVDLEGLAGRGDRLRGRARWGIPEDAVVVGHLGRLAPEKNLRYLVDALCRLLVLCPRAHGLVVGVGPERDVVEATVRAVGLAARLHFVGVVSGPDLADVLQAMDLFAITSRSETQGLVVTEAMACGVPVVGLAEPGVMDVVETGVNGALVPADASPEHFARVLGELLAEPDRGRLAEGARHTARRLSMPRTADRLLALYERLLGARRRRVPAPGPSFREALLAGAWAEWQIWSVAAAAVEHALLEPEAEEGGARGASLLAGGGGASQGSRVDGS